MLELGKPIVKFSTHLTITVFFHRMFNTSCRVLFAVSFPVCFILFLYFSRVQDVCLQCEKRLIKNYKYVAV